MKPMKMQCPICHKPIRTTHVKWYNGTKVRRYICPECDLVVQTAIIDDKEITIDKWYRNKFSKLKEVLA